MKKVLIILAAIVSLSILSMILFPDIRSRLLVTIWHLLNRSSVNLDGHRIPVPQGWVANDRGGVAILIESLKPTRADGVRSQMIISSGPPREDASWIVARTEEFLRSKGVENSERFTREKTNGKFECLKWNGFEMLPAHTISIDCYSTNGLSITFMGDESDSYAMQIVLDADSDGR